MLGRLLVLLLCFHRIRACVPVRPGEDMYCPPKPETLKIPGYKTSALEYKMMKGEMIYYCKNPSEMLLSIDDQMTVLEHGTTGEIVCPPNSGLWMLNAIWIGTKKFTCGRKLTCNDCDQSKLLDISSPTCQNRPDITCTSKPVISNGADGCLALSCSSGSLLIVRSPTRYDIALVGEIWCNGGTWMFAAEVLDSFDGFVCGTQR